MVENGKGRLWMIKFQIEDNGNVNVVKSYFEDTHEGSMYRANQFKKVSFEKEIMIGNTNAR